MKNKNLLKAMFARCKLRAKLREKQFEKKIAEIEKAEKEFEENTDYVKEKIRSIGLKVYEGPMDDIMTMVRWLENQHNEEVELREELKEVSYRSIIPF